MEKIFVGRQPILNKKGSIFGFELLFRKGHAASADVIDGTKATATVIIHSLNDLGLNNLIGKKKGFINVNAEILSSGYLELLPRENIVLELLEDIEINNNVIEMCKALKSKGFVFALDDFIYRESIEPLIGIADIVKVDLMLGKKDGLTETVKALRRYPVQLLAEKVETKEEFEFCRDLGFELFQGYFFEKPSIVEGSAASPSQLLLLEIFNELSRERDIDVIDRLFKKSPELDIKLLNFINSAAFYIRQKINSIRHAILILGYRNLQKWVSLLLFAKTGVDIKSNPLLERAAIRGLMMEGLAYRITKNRNEGDTAFITGIISISDAMLHMSIEEIIEKLNLSEEIGNALLKREGLLGDLLSLTEILERNEISNAISLAEKYNITPEELFQLETKTILNFESMETPDI
ncbi:MAG: EAL domain-containing protein [Syntrophorhabdaceae bacterium]|nr:EAL domain-containing protein [Syntrophorhabdaceae bacterium]